MFFIFGKLKYSTNGRQRISKELSHVKQNDHKCNKMQFSQKFIVFLHTEPLHLLLKAQF
jgi:hypothetical protein